MGLKAFMLIVLAIFLAITSNIAARALSQSSTTSLDKGHANEVNDAKFLGIGGLPGSNVLPGAGIPKIGGLPIPKIPEIGGLSSQGLVEGFGGAGHANVVNDAKFPGEGYDGYYPGYGYWGGYPRRGWYGGLPRN
ncbi:elastin-like [Capsicum annuum]|uniref:elastin-like n=1 Tax=Capsicum annuum TaxID=4072 RepID=UPI001FB11229|nr:elastin-like [Capsicum annuum]